MVSLLSPDRIPSRPPVVAAYRLRLLAFADIALALAEALETVTVAPPLGAVTGAVRRAFARLSPPPAGDAGNVAAYRVARDIATTDCDFVGWAANQPRRTSDPDLVLVGYGRWVREQLALLRA